MWPLRRPFTAGFLSMLLPGAGQLYLGERRRGAVLLAIAALVGVGLIGVAESRREELVGTLDERVLVGFLLVDAALLGFRLFAVVDAWLAGTARRTLIAGLVVLAALTAAPHVAAGYVAVRGYGVLDAVFADEEPLDVLPAAGGVLLAAPPSVRVLPHHDADVLEPALAQPERETPFRGAGERLADTRHVFLGARRANERAWVTILLMGSDRGPGNWGERTDTMIVAALQRGTGRAVVFGVPRNYVEVPLTGEARTSLPRFHDLLNALYQFAHERPGLFPGGEDPGGTAMKQTISRLLGIRIDYYALVDLLGFADMVDALGGVTIHVKERIVDEVTRPAWGEPKPSIDVVPGRTYHFFGREALAYVRSRKASNDYTRMTRQRCFLSALARQVDVVSVLRHFGSLSDTVEASVRTDIPLKRVPDLMRLARGVDPSRTLTQTFGLEYILRRRAADRFPLPNIPKIRATVRDAILFPDRSAREGVVSARQAC
jgi:LCP family protein required for cell wall assembly